MSAEICEFVPGLIASSRQFPFLLELERHQRLLSQLYDFLDSPDFRPGIGVAGDYSVRVGTQWNAAVAQVLRAQFTEAYGFLDEAARKYEIISIRFARDPPGSVTPLGADGAPFRYRAQIGIRLPRSKSCFKVNDTVAKWRTDRYFVSDTAQPHMAWNLSEQERVVLLLDFLREPREALVRRYGEVNFNNMICAASVPASGCNVGEDVVARFNHLVEVVDTDDDKMTMTT